MDMRQFYRTIIFLWNWLLCTGYEFFLYKPSKLKISISVGRRVSFLRMRNECGLNEVSNADIKACRWLSQKIFSWKIISVNNDTHFYLCVYVYKKILFEDKVLKYNLSNFFFSFKTAKTSALIHCWLAVAIVALAWKIWCLSALINSRFLIPPLLPPLKKCRHIAYVIVVTVLNNI